MTAPRGYNSQTEAALREGYVHTAANAGDVDSSGASLVAHGTGMELARGVSLNGTTLDNVTLYPQQGTAGMQHAAPSGGKGDVSSVLNGGTVAADMGDHEDASCALVAVAPGADADEEGVLPRFRFSWRILLKFMGPGLLMSIAYVDPGNLESCLQTGAKTGYVLLWVTLSAITMGFLVQMQAAKLGVATGQHLAEHCRKEYPPVPRYLLWVMAEVAIIGSDIQEVIGSALAIVILSGGHVPIWAGVLITASDCFALLLVDRLGFRFLEAIFAVCIGVMSGAFGYMYGVAGVDQVEVAKGFVIPRIPAADVSTAVAMVGALIMPHNIFLHSALVQSRNVKGSSRNVKRDAINYIGIESAISLTIAVFINLFVIAVFAKGFYGTDVADDVGLFSAGTYIAEKYGTSVKYIWAVGLLAAGQSSTMTGTYTGQFVMTGFLDLRISPWKRVMITRSVAIVPTLIVALSFGGNDAALDKLCQGLNLLQSVQLPFALLPVLTMCGSKRVMGSFVNTLGTSIVQWLISGAIIFINIFAIIQSAEPLLSSTPAVIFPFIVISIMYLTFVAYLVVNPWRYEVLRQRYAPLVEDRLGVALLGKVHGGGHPDAEAGANSCADGPPAVQRVSSFSVNSKANSATALLRGDRASGSIPESVNGGGSHVFMGGAGGGSAAAIEEDAANAVPMPVHVAAAMAAMDDELTIDAEERRLLAGRYGSSLPQSTRR